MEKRLKKCEKSKTVARTQYRKIRSERIAFRNCPLSRCLQHRHCTEIVSKQQRLACSWRFFSSSLLQITSRFTSSPSRWCQNCRAWWACCTYNCCLNQVSHIDKINFRADNLFIKCTYSLSPLHNISAATATFNRFLFNQPIFPELLLVNNEPMEIAEAEQTRCFSCGH